MLECPSLLATLAIDTPANNKIEACVCRKPCTEITGTFAFLQYLLRISFTVELYTFHLIKTGLSSGNPLINSEN